MKIAVLGYGNIGGTMGRKWACEGHEVVFGVRNPEKAQVKELLESIEPETRALPINEALDWGEVVLFAIPANAMEETIAAYPGSLNEKIVIDSTNRFDQPEVNSIRYITAHSPQAIVFRAFNSLGWEVFASPDYLNGEVADHFYVGPDGAQRKVVDKLISEIGVRPVYVGGLDNVALVDNLGRLWVHLVFTRKFNRRLAFKMIGA